MEKTQQKIRKPEKSVGGQCGDKIEKDCSDTVDKFILILCRFFIRWTERNSSVIVM